MWMLAPECGGIRPWEMDLLTPDEERRIVEYRRRLDAQAQEVT